MRQGDVKKSILRIQERGKIPTQEFSQDIKVNSSTLQRVLRDKSSDALCHVAGETATFIAAFAL